MQKIKVTRVESKPTAKGSTLVAIYDEKQTRFSGFHKDLQEVREGDVIEADIQVDGKYNNIISFKFLERGTGPVDSSSSFKSLERNIENRRSIERQVALKVAAQINTAPVLVEKLLNDAEKIAAWIAGNGAKPGEKVAEARQKRQDEKTGGGKPESVTKDIEEKPEKLKNVQELLTRASKLKPAVYASELIEALSVNKPAEIKDLEAAWDTAQQVSKSKANK